MWRPCCTKALLSCDPHRRRAKYYPDRLFLQTESLSTAPVTQKTIYIYMLFPYSVGALHLWAGSKPEQCRHFSHAILPLQARQQIQNFLYFNNLFLPATFSSPSFCLYPHIAYKQHQR